MHTTLVSAADDERKFLIGRTPLAVAFLVFVMSIIVNSDVFVETILSKMNGTINGTSVTNRGVVIQAMMLGLIIALLMIVKT